MEKKAQVWVETVIYTLIGLAIIGIILAASKPKIEEMKDKILIEQTIESLNEISSKIHEVQIAAGNRRVFPLGVSEGTFYVNGQSDEIGWTLDSTYKYSELDRIVPLGNMLVVTTAGSPYLVKFYIDYQENISFAGSDELKNFAGSPTPYKLIIENKGVDSGNRNNIDLNVG